MIVKNESQIIERLLSSVVSIIDSYCICDTGSTDDTIDIIETFFEKHNIDGKIFEEPFRDFGYNRSYALKKAEGMSDYVLLLDADMILIKGDFDKSILHQADSFCILQGNENFYYKNMRIVKNNGLFKYCGVTHEHVSTPSNNKNIDLGKKTLFINDVGDGGSKENKFERDIRLLQKGIQDEPNNVRYHFYLANSYKDIGKFDEAIEYYKKRIRMGNWEQEIWYSYYCIANIYETRNDIGNAVLYWLKAYNLNPNRLENIYKIVQHYRLTGECQIAKLFYDIAITTLNKNINRDDFLFLANDVYTYKFDYEFSIIACYLGISNINDSIVKIFNNSSDDSILTNTMSNLKFYKDTLPNIKLIDLSFSEFFDIENVKKKFFSSSASITPNQNKNGYMINIRLVNYWINENGGYLNCDDYIISNNKYIETDKSFKVTKEKTFEFKLEEKRYIGIEDIRIFPDQNNHSKLVYMGTSQHQNGTIGMLYGNYDPFYDYIISQEIKPSFCESWCEKNWVYFRYKNENHVIYKWSPIHICKINSNTNELDIVEIKEGMPKIFLHVRGSSPGFKFYNEYWFLLHIVSFETPRHYYHILAIFDNEMNFKKHSAPFKFEGESIEYSLGLVVEDERVIIPYSTWDRTTKIAVYDKNLINERIKYPLE